MARFIANGAFTYYPRRSKIIPLTHTLTQFFHRLRPLASFGPPAGALNTTLCIVTDLSVIGVARLSIGKNDHNVRGIAAGTCR